MKSFFAFIKKEFFHILRDRRTMLLLLGIPIMQIMLFGFAINMEITNIRTAILIPHQDNATKRLCEKIAANSYFEVVAYVENKEQIEQLFNENRIDAGIVFSQDFGKKIAMQIPVQLQFLTDATDPNTATIAANYIKAIVTDWQKNALNLQTIPYNIKVETLFLFNPEMESAYNFVPGVIGMVLMLICAMMTSISIVREKERGTMEVLLVSPLRPISIIFAKAIPYFTLSFINLTSILLLAVYVLDVPIRGSLWLLLGVCMLFILLSLSLGLLISSVVETQVAAIMISGIGLMMPVMLLSGMIFPIGNMPSFLQIISNVIPARWFIAAMRKIMIEGQGLLFIWKEIAILFGMTAVFLTLSLINMKPRLQ